MSNVNNILISIILKSDLNVTDSVYSIELLFVDTMSGSIQTVMFIWPKQKDSSLSDDSSSDDKFTDSSGKLISR